MHAASRRTSTPSPFEGEGSGGGAACAARKVDSTFHPHPDLPLGRGKESAGDQKLYEALRPTR